MAYSDPAMRGASAVFVVMAWLAWLSTLSPAQNPGQKAASTTREAGLTAWQQVFSVLTYPRCLNCHTATNYPQQGDDRHRHLFNVVRGPGGKGVAGLNCATCHQSANADSTGFPGAHNWHLAPLSMSWQDRSDNILTSPAVCRSLTDRSKNGSLDGPGILRHHEQEPLVLWAFQPGRHRDGTERSLPPLTHQQFVAATRIWVDAGMPCPQ
jgi:mono/diheme cytochrome c family protein